MHRRLTALVTLVLACNAEPQNNPTSDAGAIAPDAAPAAFSDAQVVGVLDALDEGETQEGQLAVTSAVRLEIASFASQTVTDHTSAKATLTRIGIAPADSALSVRIRAKAAQDLVTLKALKGATFDATYVTTQVADHVTALATIDMVLMRAASNPALATQLGVARDLVTDHLAHARALQESIQ
jgi:predicted outer membrane protein